MRIGLSELVLFVYTLGVLFTGTWAADSTLPELTPFRLTVLFVLAIVWTAYSSVTVIPRIVDIETEDEDEEDDEVGPMETAQN